MCLSSVVYNFTKIYFFVIPHPGESSSEMTFGASIGPSLCRPADRTVLALIDFFVSQEHSAKQAQYGDALT